MNMETEKWLSKNGPIIRSKVTNISGLLAILSSTDPQLITDNESEEIKNDTKYPTKADKWDQISHLLSKKSIQLPLAKLKDYFVQSEQEYILQGIHNSESKGSGLQISHFDNFNSPASSSSARGPNDYILANIRKDADLKFWVVGHRDRNQHFTGREEIFKILENSLESKLWENSTQKFVLYGMGGVGKTSTVTEFLYRNRTKFSNVFWFGAEVNLVQQICQLAKKLNFGNYDAIDPKDQNEIAQNFIKSWFDKRFSSCWLIVYDNVENFEDIRHFIPSFGGILVATSRNTINWSDVTAISVNYFEKYECFQLIKKILNIENYDQQFERLIQDLGELPLAISNASHFITSKKITINEYLNYSKKTEEEYLKICPDFEEKSVWISVKISLDKIKEESPLAFEFLKILSYFLAEEIPKLFLEEFLEIKKISKMKIIEVQEFLLKYDMVKLESRGEHQLYSIHRLVQKSIRLISVENEYEILIISSEIIKNVCNQYTALDTKYILQHAIHLLLYLIEFVQKQKNAQAINKLLILNNIIVELILDPNLLRWLFEIKDLDKIFSKYFETIEKILLDSKDIFWLNFAMAGCFLVKNDFQNAIQFDEKLLVLSREIFGEFSEVTSTVYNNTGICYSNLNQFTKALEFFEKSLKINIQLYGVDSSELISKYNNLGTVCIHLKDYKKAEEYLDKALNLINKHQLQNSFQVSYNFSLLGDLNFELGKLEDARENYKKGLNVKKQLYGENSLQVFNQLKIIGDYYATSNASFALEFYIKMSDFETHFQNGPSKETLHKIRICNQKILKQNPLSSKMKRNCLIF